MEVKFLALVEALALKKQKIYRQSRVRFILKSILASMFIGFGVIVAFKTGDFFCEVQSPFAYPMAAITFGAAIILISYGGGDLFTGNTFYFTFAALRKKISWMEVSKIWLTSYFGNIIGAAFFAKLIFTTGLFEGITEHHFLMTVVEKKMLVSLFLGMNMALRICARLP